MGSSSAEAEGGVSSGTSDDLSGGSHSSTGIETTGTSPFERRNATMLSLGPDKLVIIGGMTIEDGHDARTGDVFDDVCVSLGLSWFQPRFFLFFSFFTDKHGILCVLCRPIVVASLTYLVGTSLRSFVLSLLLFYDWRSHDSWCLFMIYELSIATHLLNVRRPFSDTTRLHWSKIRPAGDKAKDTRHFFLESLYCKVPPSATSMFTGWQIFVQGKAYDFDDIIVTVAEQEGVAHERSPRQALGHTQSPHGSPQISSDSPSSAPPSVTDDMTDKSPVSPRFMPPLASASLADNREPSANTLTFPLRYALPRTNSDFPLSDFNPGTRSPPYSAAPPPPSSYHAHSEYPPATSAPFATSSQHPYSVPVFFAQNYHIPTMHLPLPLQHQFLPLAYPPQEFQPYPPIAYPLPPALPTHYPQPDAISQPLSVHARPFIPQHLRFSASPTTAVTHTSASANERPYSRAQNPLTIPLLEQQSPADTEPHHAGQDEAGDSSGKDSDDSAEGTIGICGLRCLQIEDNEMFLTH